MNGLSSLGRLFLFFGVIMLVIGGILLGLGSLFNIGRLPGDIVIKKGNFTFYFPVVTSILLSIVLSLIFSLLLRR